MGLLGKTKTEECTESPSCLKHPLSKTAQQLKKMIEPAMMKLSSSFTRNDAEKQLSASLIIMEQNEIIIKYLDDISKKLDDIR